MVARTEAEAVGVLTCAVLPMANAAVLMAAAVAAGMIDEAVLEAACVELRLLCRGRLVVVVVLVGIMAGERPE